MENLAEKFLLNIADQIKTHITNIVHGPFYIENFNLWTCVIDCNKPAFGSLRFNVFLGKNGELSELSLEFYSEQNHVLLLEIFKKTEDLLKTTVYDIFQTEGCITLNWKIDLSNDKEIFIFLNKTLNFFQKFFILIKDLGLIALKKSDELFDRKKSTFAYTRKEKTKKTITKSGMKLIRKTRPAILSSVKSYYYLELN